MAITEMYANFDLTTGTNAGTSEANAWQSPADIVYAAGERVNIKTPTRHTMTATHSSATAGSTTQPIYVRGYTTTIGDGGAILLHFPATAYQWGYTGDNVIAEGFDITDLAPVWQTPFSFQSDGGLISNLKLISTTAGVHTDPRLRLDDCAFDNIYIETDGSNSSTGEAFYSNRAHGSSVVVVCNNGQRGVELGAGFRANSVSHILVYSGVSTTLSGINIVGYPDTTGLQVDHFTVDGFDEGVLFSDMPSTVTYGGILTNGVISGAVDAITTDAATIKTGFTMGSIAFYNNTNDYSAMGDNEPLNPIALTADPYEDSANGDFRPNDTASGGALLRGQTKIGAGMITNNQDIGALQHADPAGGGGTGAIVNQGLHAIDSGIMA